MSKATANCICKQCGEEFIKTTIKRNTQEANDWISWAERNFTQCPQCWAKEQNKIKMETPAYVEIKLDPFSRKGIAVFGGNTIERKDEIKSLGYNWDDEPTSGVFGMLSMTRPKKCWSKSFDLANMGIIINEIKEFGAEIKNSISDIDIIAAKKIADDKAKEKAELDAKLAEIKKPKVPEVLNGHRWNGKIYGRKGNYSIYPDSVKTEITDEQAAEIELYLTAKDEYKEKPEKSMI